LKIKLNFGEEHDPSIFRDEEQTRQENNMYWVASKTDFKRITQRFMTRIELFIAIRVRISKLSEVFRNFPQTLWACAEIVLTLDSEIFFPDVSQVLIHQSP
jgi:hypothetical protein